MICLPDGDNNFFDIVYISNLPKFLYYEYQ